MKNMFLREKIWMICCLKQAKFWKMRVKNVGISSFLSLFICWCNIYSLKSKYVWTHHPSTMHHRFRWIFVVTLRFLKCVKFHVILGFFRLMIFQFVWITDCRLFLNIVKSTNRVGLSFSRRKPLNIYIYLRCFSYIV